MYVTRHFKDTSWDSVMSQFNSFLACNTDAYLLDYFVSKHQGNFILVCCVYVVD